MPVYRHPHSRKALLIAALMSSIGCAQEDAPTAVSAPAQVVSEPSNTASVRLDALDRRGLRQNADAIGKLAPQEMTEQTPTQVTAAAGLLASLGFNAEQLGSPACDAKALFQAALDFDRGSADFEDAAALSEITGVARFVERNTASDKGDGFLGETELAMIENWGAKKPSAILVRSASGVRPDGAVEDISSAPEPVGQGTYLVFASEALYRQAVHERGKAPASSPTPHVQLLTQSVPLDRIAESVGSGAMETTRNLDDLRPVLVNAIALVDGCRSSAR